ncbi:terminase large subunit domain-containing protein [Caldimonas sp. KR1-144]|uniref:terminase large subunit domain-containing protein n=1 Tax=Caldimonas sp. KR1-144 TaxID=3400911 RepID=UPI003C0333B2
MPTLNEPQAEFLALERKYRAFVSGFGGGKTWAGGAALCKHAWERPRINAGYFAPTFPMIRDIFYPTIDEVAQDWNLTIKVNESNKEVHVYSGRRYRTTIICRSMENPGDIAGFKIGHAQVDELDLLKIDKAALAWRKIIARMRYSVPGLRNGIDVTTTPEGFKFVYRQFVKEVAEQPEKLGGLYGIVQASTFDNEANLPDDYIDSLRASYPPQLIEAYLRGRFVNLASGSVYPEFDRRLNHTDAEIKPGEVLHIGMDFNVNKMAAVVYVVRDGAPLALAEHTGVRDTPAMAKLLKDRYQTGREAKDRHEIRVYPDASGQNTSSKDASESDLSILKQAGLPVVVNPTNPAVKDRVNAVNALILNDKGERRLKVNTRHCPNFTEALEQQIYDPKSGEPDKKAGLDHVNDAGGYFLVKQWPIVRRTATVERLRA